MIDKYRLDDVRLESGEKGDLARWVIQLQTDLDRERRRGASERAIISRLEMIMHGSETDLDLLTVTAQSLVDCCKAGGVMVAVCEVCGSACNNPNHPQKAVRASEAYKAR
jgi:light-regulated signal transduction histidine kinase (bacteriophytochrome)